MKISFYNRKVAKEVSCKNENEDPRDGTEDIKRNEALVVHGTDTGNEWRKRSDDRSESRGHNREGSPLVIEGLSFSEIFFLEEASVFIKNFGAEKFSDVIVHGIAENSGHR